MITAASSDAVQVNGESEIVFMDSAGGGMIESTMNSAGIAAVRVNSGTVTMKSGSYKGLNSFYLNGGSVVIEDGYYSSFSSIMIHYVICVSSGTLLIEGGTLDGSAATATVYINENVDVTVTGGILKPGYPSSMGNQGLNFSLLDSGRLDLSRYPNPDGMTVNSLSSVFTNLDIVTLPEGYVFVNTDGAKVPPGTTLTGSTRLDRLATVRLESELKTYSVAFESGGSGEMETVTDVIGRYTLPECGFTPPEGQRFKAWSIDGEEYPEGASYTVAADTVVTALWQDGFVITFDAGDGSGSMEPAGRISASYTLPECTFTPPKDMAFKAWRIDGKEYKPGTTITVTADTTAEAVWMYPAATVTEADGTLAGDYETIEEAIAAAAERPGSTLQLREVVTVDSVVLEGGSYTIDLNEQTIYYEHTGFYLCEGADIIFLNSGNPYTGGDVISSTAKNNSEYVLEVEEGCRLTIKEGIYNNNREYAIRNYGTVIVEKGTFYAGEGASGCVLNYGELTINNGTLTGKTIVCQVSGSTVINNGSLSGETTIRQEGGSTEINGGSFGDLGFLIDYMEGTVDLSGYPSPDGFIF